jgi:hypothetical protein
MRVEELLVPVFGLGILLVRFLIEVVAVLVALSIWDRWFRRRQVT